MIFMSNVLQIRGLEKTGSISLLFSLLSSLPQANKHRNICCIRWAFIDLSAGPFSWGPAVGGEGVRTELSLPNVEKTIGAVSGTTGNSCQCSVICIC